MSAYVLHQGAMVQCDHAGQAQPTPTFPRVKVAGQAVVTQQAVYSVTGCGLSSSGGTPCATGQYVTAATRVKAGGTPVLLKDSQARCVPTGGGLTAASTQTRVKGT